ncbi:hypothetical protein J4231_00615 [Candidatus Woesearchaeota archaeon]|nr:hypothetical protein [Candidatus Woesearchaeota archaeon]
MEKNYLIVGLIVLLLAFAIFQSFQISKLKNGGLQTVTGNAAGSGAIDMTGWTEDEKMMYEHHGTLPNRAQGGNAQPSSGMVGGC